MTPIRHTPFRILSVAGMEICWLYAILLLAHHRACDQCLFIPALFLFYLAAFGFHRLIGKGNPLISHVISWFVWLVCAVLFAGFLSNEGFGFQLSWISSLVRRVFSLASFPTWEFLTLAGSGVLWGCGKRLARIAGDGSVILSEFQFGTFMLLIVFFLASQWKLDLDGLVPITMIFFFFALTGLPANLLQAGSGWSLTGRKARWFAIIVCAVCLVLIAGLIVASIMKPDLMNQILSLVEAAARFVGRVIARIIAFLMSFFPDPEPSKFDLPLPPSSGADRDPSFIARMFRIPESVRRVASMIVSGIWICLFLAAMWSLSSSLIKWLLQRVSLSNGMEVETLSGAFREDLIALLKAVVRNMDRLFSMFLGLFGLKRIRRIASPENVSVRSVYKQLLRWASRKGVPRPRAQTPGEYLDLLAKKLPGGYDEFSLITSGYIEARYSKALPPPGTIERIVASWKALRRKRGKSLNRQVR
ncbi:MAG: hypothetical protein CVU57_11870 [Deltaproteobacteria bacterium HGW-Deltaproteobacteria-15]|jgi:hypothetical protein|nr:MAG: hypothetical protein CVU57_11870 [Deltaproteobacteria bacterium HGW-Deltaproteobacteria-15]